jgi:hypothetical protein
MSGVIGWAENEVELAKARLKWDNDGSAILAEGYDIALRAYKTIFQGDGEGLSGCGFSFVSEVLKDLLDEKPLTPIADVPEVWSLDHETDEFCEFQCCRRSALFKRVYKKDSRVTYHDVDRVVCMGEASSQHAGFTGRFHNGFVSRLIEDKYPISMPYIPTKPYVVKVSDFATNGAPGEFDTMFVKSVIHPNGKIETLNWYFKETPDGFINIDEKEYLDRYQEYLSHQTTTKPERN